MGERVKFAHFKEPDILKKPKKLNLEEPVKRWK